MQRLSTNGAVGAQPAVEISACGLLLGRSGKATIEFRLDRLAIQTGEQVALTGPSGCGKSTLLNLVSGLLLPDVGSIRVLGTEINCLGSWRRDRFRGRATGFIYQNLNLLEGFNALENVLLGMRFGRVVRHKEQHARAVELLGRVGLERRMHLRPGRLSMGERQRVAIARALANRPALLLADEPTGALDPATADTVFGLIQGLCRETACTLLFVTHDMQLAARLPRNIDCRGLVGHRAAEGVAA
jgi:ABC-type lipoprotein export system ATPase subunit